MTLARASQSYGHTLDAKGFTAEEAPVRRLLLSLALWLMVWVGYNTDIKQLTSPGFPAGALDLVHGCRALLPFAAAYLAVIVLLARCSLPLWLFKGPLGLLALYTLVGTTSSILSHEPLTALYWAAQYYSVIIVLWAIMANSNSLPRLSYLINLNWAIVAGMTVALFAFLLGVISSLGSLGVGGFLAARPYEGLGGVPPEMEILGMAGTRPTGLGRYAGVAALVALARLWQGTRWSRSIWFLLFLFFLSILVFSQARTAVLGFLAGALFILWLKSRSKLLLISGTGFTLLLLGLAGFYEAFYTYLQEEMSFVFTLSGRTIGVWREGWNLFLSSPLLGYGFHADRIFLEGQHMHNSLLHALVQTGLIGTVPFMFAFIWAWIILFRLLRRLSVLKTTKPLVIEAAGVLAYLTVRTITESVGAFYGAEWLLLAPLLAYITILNQRKSSL